MKNHWKKLLSREGVDITTISVIDLVFFELISKFSNSNKELFFTKFDNRQLTHYIGVDPLELGRKLYRKYFFGLNKILKYCQTGEKYFKELKQNYEESSKQLDVWDNKTALKIFSQFEKDFLNISNIFSINSYLAIEAWQNDYDACIQKLIKANGLEKESEALTVSAYLPWKKTALRCLMDELKSGKNPKHLADKYQFLRSWSAVWHGKLDETWVMSLGGNGSVGQTKYMSNKQLIKKIKPNGEYLKFFQLAPCIVYFKDFRDDVRRFQVYYYSFLFEKIASHFQIPTSDIGYLTVSEIKQCLINGIFDRKKVEFRKNNPFVITINSNGSIIVKHSNLNKYFSIEKSIQKISIQPIIKGIIASKGKVVGPVKIIHSHHDIKRVVDGDIIVANTTHPDYLPAMKRASGFITNEGGLISHAAIVARELNKPCLVGTKNATFVLFEGQIIELDTNIGEVRIL